MTEPGGEFTLAQAAEYCGVTLHVIRKRADRGSIEVTRRDGQRYVTRQALADAGLLPDVERQELEAKVKRLEGEVAAHRRLVAAEQENTQRAHDALVEERAKAAAAAAQLAELDQELAGAGPIRAWKIARQRRVMATAAGS